MHSPQLNNPISLPFMPLEELTPRRIMFEIERVLQSHEEFVLGNDFYINLIHVKMPSGSGNWRRCGVNLQTRMLRKNVVSDEWACEEGWNNYFVSTGENAAWDPGRCIMGRKKGVYNGECSTWESSRPLNQPCSELRFISHRVYVYCFALDVGRARHVNHQEGGFRSY